MALTEEQPEQNETEHAENMRKLKDAVAHGARLQAEFDRLAPGVAQAKRDRIALLLQARSVEANLKAKSMELDPLSFPSEARLKQQAAEVKALTELLGEILANLRHAERRCEPLLDCVRLQQAIVTQRFVVANLKTLCEGGQPGTLEGGLSTAPDLIGSLPPMP